ncbi:hypothetical protein H920_18203 [Fukomys damarensis]|uniref:Uncharacterized protein n=1 Tax=Fukomys damarensis TaxID=885580 RepID=A0A091CQL7_FUKDA|nr:hypothetical protein H920_18203 [Fukomys damarensis]
MKNWCHIRSKIKAKYFLLLWSLTPLDVIRSTASEVRDLQRGSSALAGRDLGARQRLRSFPDPNAREDLRVEVRHGSCRIPKRGRGGLCGTHPQNTPRLQKCRAFSFEDVLIPRQKEKAP